MTTVVVPYKNPQKHTCASPICDGRPAKWQLPQLAALGLPSICCGVHIKRFADLTIEHHVAPITIDIKAFAEVEAFENREKTPCQHPHCDGRPARWKFPQTTHLGSDKLVCCSSHLVRFVEIVISHRLYDTQTKSVTRAIRSIAYHHAAGAR